MNDAWRTDAGSLMLDARFSCAPTLGQYRESRIQYPMNELLGDSRGRKYIDGNSSIWTNDAEEITA
jgi:hypothetical protein